MPVGDEYRVNICRVNVNAAQLSQHAGSSVYNNAGSARPYQAAGGGDAGIDGSRRGAQEGNAEFVHAFLTASFQRLKTLKTASAPMIGPLPAERSAG